MKDTHKEARDLREVENQEDQEKTYLKDIAWVKMILIIWQKEDQDQDHKCTVNQKIEKEKAKIIKDRI